MRQEEVAQERLARARRVESVPRQELDIQTRARGRPLLGTTAFGLGLLGDLAPPGAWAPQPATEPRLRLQLATPQAIAECWSGIAEIGWEGIIDGARFLVERGRAGDHRFVHGTEPERLQDWDGRQGQLPDGIGAVHHLSADAALLRCAPARRDESLWWRVVLDSVLFTTALLRGYEALHAGALASSDGVIAITATTGGGKSTLVAELLGHGLTLMADDVLVLESSRPDDPPLAHPAPPLMTVPAVRMQTLARIGSPVPIASLGTECWVPVPVHPGPLPLIALVVLDRRSGVTTRMRRADSPLPALLRSLLRFPRTPERERARFEMAAAISAQVPIWELDADPSVDPGELADLVIAKIIDSRSRPMSGLSALG